VTVIGCGGENLPEDGIPLDSQHYGLTTAPGTGSRIEDDGADAADQQPAAGHLTSSPVDPHQTSGSDHFHCFQEGNCTPPSLSGSTICQEGRDYDIKLTEQHGDVAVLSFHGGDIEPESSELARVISNQFGWSRYDFSAHPTAGCLAGDSSFTRMHITSTHFDDPAAVDLVGRNSRALAIHGYSDDRGNDRGAICVGGSNSGQVTRFIAYINSHKASFTAYPLRAINAAAGEDGGSGANCQGLAGTASKNIVNQAGGGEGGLQLEMNGGIKADLLNHSSSRYDALRSVIFGAIGAAMSN
jgi:phage replication-related protein YjqB (UPF0714/DUF867 family)